MNRFKTLQTSSHPSPSGRAREFDSERKTTPKERTSRESHTVDTSRAGEIALLVPETAPIDARPLSEGEKSKYDEIDESEEKHRLQKIADELIASHSSFSLPLHLRKTGMMILLFFAATATLFLVGQIVSSWAQLLTLPKWGQYVVVPIMVLSGLALLIVIAKIVALFFRLKKNQKIVLSGLKALESRADLRALSAQQNRKAIEIVASYLHEFPTNDSKTLASAGLIDLEICKLSKVQKELLAEVDRDNPGLWLGRFRDDFQQVLDDCAKRKISQYMKQVGLKTAISPLPLLDNAIVLTSCLAMVKDLMALYNLRPSSGASVQILLHAIIQTYLAGEIQDFTESIADSAVDMIGEQLGQVFAGFTKNVGSKVGEGAVNAIMIRRIGNATTALLRPVDM